MYKRALHHLLTRLRPVKTWYLLLACLLCSVAGIVALRDNYSTMRTLRTEVYVADQNNGDIIGALNRLRSYVNAHMNTNLASDSSVYPPIQLTHTYQRLQKAEKDRVNEANSRIYTEAQSHCEQMYPGSFSGGPRVPCIAQYVKDHGTTAKPIPEAMYKFNFATPAWSPDSAGITLAVSGLLGAATVLRFVAGRVLESLSS